MLHDAGVAVDARDALPPRLDLAAKVDGSARFGADVRLPEENTEAALTKLVAFDRETRILSRDVAAIDLRIPDRISVRPSAEAAEALAAALKSRMPKRAGSDT